MKTTRMYCENCGKEFYSEYYRGGYIDHMNMVNNFGCFLYRDIDNIVRVICYDGNDFREIDDIDDRLVCMTKWLRKNASLKVIKEVISKVEEKKEYIRDLIKIRKEIQDKIYSLKDYEARCFIKNHLFV